MGYERYGLSENPFPGDAIINPYAGDKKRNGSIFAVNARRKTIHLFEKRFIGRTTSFDDRQKIGFLWAEGDRESGRGVGKTALLVYMKHLVNEGWGSAYWGEGRRILSLYVSFSQQIRDYPVEHICQLALVACLQENLFNVVRTTPGVNKTSLTAAGVSDEFATHVMAGDVEDYLKSFRKDRSLHLPRPPRDMLLLSSAKNLFLKQTVLCLQVAGFSGGVLFIDDIENITDQSGRKHLETFAKDLGSAYLRGDNPQARDQFLSLVLTTHSSAARRLAEAWEVSGLAAAYPMDPAGESSVEVPRPDVAGSLDMIKEYLDASRVPSWTGDPLSPFDHDAVELVVQRTAFHPRKYISACHRILKAALEEGVEHVTRDFAANRVQESARPVDDELPGLDEL